MECVLAKYLQWILNSPPNNSNKNNNKNCQSNEKRPERILSRMKREWDDGVAETVPMNFAVAAA